MPVYEMIRITGLGEVYGGHVCSWIKLSRLLAAD